MHATMPIMMLNGLGCDCQNQSTVSFMGFGEVTVPKFSDTPTTDWTCAQWMMWHKDLVRAFEAGLFASKIKYTHEAAIQNANDVFRIHWDKNSKWYNSLQFCGYSSDFFDYFKSVGLTDILSYFQGIITPAASTAVNVTSTAQSVVENAADTVANTTSVAKYAVPLLVGGLAIGVGYYVYKNYLKGNKKVKVGPLGGPPKKRRTKKKK